MVPLVDGIERPPLLRCEAFRDHAPKMPMSLEQWLTEAPDLVTEHSPLQRTYRRSLLDLAALRVRPDDVRIRWAMPGGGLPWFMTIFGRDSIISSYQLLPVSRRGRTGDPPGACRAPGGGVGQLA
jgi:glycogen debranching enzyme